jgi:hypothetical protein
LKLSKSDILIKLFEVGKSVNILVLRSKHRIALGSKRSFQNSELLNVSKALLWK